MLAAILARPRHWEMVQAEKPSPSPGQMRIRVLGCGVCGSNLPLWQGRSWFTYPVDPGSPGHEAWGVVDALGPEVSGFAVGEPVTMLSYRSFAAYDLAAADHTVKLPPALACHPFPGEALACALNIMARADIRPRQNVAIVGAGFLGTLLTRLCAAAGAAPIAISRRTFSLAIASSNGAAACLPISNKTVAAVLELTNGDGCERVIEAVGMQSTLDLATQLVAVGGRLIIAGYHQDGRRTVDLQQWNWRGIDVINAHERDENVRAAALRAAVDAVQRGDMQLETLITHQFPLSEINEAFRSSNDRPDGFIKAVVCI
jgi:2-desacetyl-2-hydroxyethyl bacteriochlorophyllide A dehydrogenase